jgi:VWFA-related protein
MRLRPSLYFLALAVFSAANTMAAQDEVIRVNTRLVEVNVVVRDKNGPVSDLAKDDFIVFDDGKPQRIDVFSVSPLDRAKPTDIAPPMPVGVVSNRTGSGVAASATVILFDRLNTSDRYQRDGHRQLLSYLKSAGREDLTALYVLGDDVKLVQDFTNDADKLVRAASRMEIGDLPGVDNRTVTEIAQSTAVGRVSRRDVRTAVAVAEFSVEQRTDPTDDAIELIARHLGGLPGRKSVIWMSADIPLSISAGTSRDGRDSQLGRATRLLTAANIAVYPVNTRGLLAPDPPRGRRGRGNQSAPPPDVMIRLADATGGRAFYFDNDLESSIRTAIADAGISYTLGFYPAENGFDGKFHNLSVKVRRNDVEVRHRSGYLAAKDGPSEQERRSIISELLSSPLDTSQIGLQASAQAVEGKAGVFRILLSVDSADLRLEHRANGWAGILDVAIRLESSKQKTVQMRTVNIDLTEERFRAALQRGLLLEDTVTTEKAVDRVRIVLQDRATGFAGSLWLPLVKK